MCNFESNLCNTLGNIIVNEFLVEPQPIQYEKCSFIILLRFYASFMAFYFHCHVIMHVMEMSSLEGTSDAKGVSELNIFTEHF